jgi:hypothetical protein
MGVIKDAPTKIESVIIHSVDDKLPIPVAARSKA